MALRHNLVVVVADFLAVEILQQVEDQPRLAAVMLLEGA